MPPRKSPPAPAPADDPDTAYLAEETVGHIRALWRILFRNPIAEAEEEGLTGPQVSVMAFLVSKGPSAVTEVARAVGMGHSTASGIVDRLQARGLVERGQDPADRRRSVVRVTGSVTRYVRGLMLGPSGRVAEVFARMSVADRRGIARALARLHHALDPRAE